MIPVKPISGFSVRYHRLLDKLRSSATTYTPQKPFVLLVVGSGAGGVELVLAVQYKLKQLFWEVGADPDAIKVHIV